MNTHVSSIPRPHRWVESFCRVGYVAKGVVYSLVGVLALQTAIAGGTRTESSKGALVTIAQQPFGTILLSLVVLGLFAYAAWRFCESVLDVEDHGSDSKALAKRLFFLISGISYATLAVWGASLVLGLSGGAGSGQGWSAKLMGLPWGRWLVGLVGVALVGVACRQFYRALTDQFMKVLATSQMSVEEVRTARWIGRIGITARAVTFLVMGGFVLHAAWTFDPDEARGLSGALDALARAPYGSYLLGAVGVGFVLYGMHCLARARYRRIG